MKLPKLIMMFDVESVGLHGEGFAVGYVILDSGEEIDKGLYSCPLESAQGNDEDRQWVSENVMPHLPEPNRRDPKGVRAGFWADWMHWKEQGALLFTDCGWPVEGHFLNACVADDPELRRWNGPYPLFDLSSILLANRENPIGTFPRFEDELPVHNPLSDARQSSRVLLTACKI
jgi:hypothetical protein